MRAVAMVAVLLAWNANAGPAERRELARPRCYVSAREDAIACPQSSELHDAKAPVDGGSLVFWFWAREDVTTVVVDVGRDYAGTVAFAPPIGVRALRARLTRGGFRAAAPAREVRREQWLPTRPRSRLVWNDEVQLDAVLEVDCGKGRLVRDDFTITGQRFFASVFGDRVALFGELVSGERALSLIDTSVHLAKPSALCATSEND